ncbi:MAG: class I SAM-dependent methyltransferase, partial [Bacteroidota bacterium]
MYEEAFKSNKHLWNVWAANHAKAGFYDVEGFKAGQCALKHIEVEALGAEVTGKSLLHLQCHFGLDSLSWARRGADVTGIDFSREAIQIARALSTETSIPATFVESDLYDLPNQLQGTFDMIFTSYGVLGWLPDLEKWAAIIGQFLKPGGTFYIVEFHPFFYTFEFADQEMVYPYFNHGAIKEENEGSYAHRGAEYKTTSYWW